MASRKITLKYYFSVDGETEQWYFEWLENLDQYKHENNFKRILRNLCLQDVIDAVRRAQIITTRNQEHGYSLINYKGYSYYRENPSLSIWESISKILFDCGLLKA